MKKQSRLFTKSIAWISSLFLAAGMVPHTVLADTGTSSAMSLIRCEGTVEVEDASGNLRSVMENAGINSGEALKTAEASYAAVGLDQGRTVTLDEKSRVEFEKREGAVSMNLTEGLIFLDVSEKLGDGETMNIRTSSAEVGIRGTIVYVSSEPVDDEAGIKNESPGLAGLSPERGRIVSITQIGVLEGTAQVAYLDNSGQRQSVSVDAGQKAAVHAYSADAQGIPEPSVSPLTKEDIEGFVLEQVTSDAATVNRVQEACDVVDDFDLSGLAGMYTADGDWTWDSPVTLVAQSASKYYDGLPLTRSADILVDGLPSIFSVKASAGGSRTDAGESDNPVSNYSIFNKAGEDVTRHFSNVHTVSGSLLVVPAPLTIHTGSAGKVYDGTSLTGPDASVTFCEESGTRETPWRNTSYAVTEAAGNSTSDGQTLYGICGVTQVNGANPLTGERREIQLKAGQKLTIFLSDLEGRQSIEFKTEDLTENDLPEELLRLYGDNPLLLQQACTDTGWDIELLRELIAALPQTPSGTATIEQSGLVIRKSESDRLMQDLTNVSITIDTETTDYNNRALGSEEACYTSPSMDESIKVTATGSQTDAGTGINTYTIDWGTADRSNYEVKEDLGTLTVTPASAFVSTGSAVKEYDGRPLTNAEASISGLVNGETATVTATGSITEVGSAINTCSISWGTAKSSNYSVNEDLGVLKVTAPNYKSPVTLTAGSAGKTYDGTALTESSVTAEGLPSGFTVSAGVSGSRTDAGSSKNTITSYKIYDADGSDVTGRFSNVITQSGTLTVYPLPVEFDLCFNSEEGTVYGYDGSLQTPEWILASYEGADEPVEPAPADENADEEDEEDEGAYSFTFSLPGEASLRLSGTGYKETGSYTFVPEITFLKGKKGNYEITFTNNTFEIEPAELTIVTGSAEKEYDGSPLTNAEASVSGLVNGETATVTATGSITEIGSAKNTCSISWGTAKSSNYRVTENLGILKVTDPKEKAVTLTAGSAEKTYDGTALTESSVTAEGLPSGFTVSAEVSGSRTDAGSSENTITSYTIYDADGSDVTGQFSDVITQSGTLTVHPLPVEFDLCFNSEEGAIFVYDGSPQTPEWILASYEGTDEPVEPVDWNPDETYSFTFTLPGDASLQLSGTGYKNAGSYTFVPEITFLKGEKGNYEITFTNNTFEIEPAELKVVTGSAEKEYDGSPLTNAEASVSGLVNGETATVTATGSITEAGSAKNTYSIDWGDTNPYNYSITEELGTLTVRPVLTGMFSALSSTDEQSPAMNSEAEEKKAADGHSDNDDHPVVSGDVNGKNEGSAKAAPKPSPADSNQKEVKPPEETLTEETPPEEEKEPVRKEEAQVKPAEKEAEEESSEEAPPEEEKEPVRKEEAQEEPGEKEEKEEI